MSANVAKAVLFGIPLAVFLGCGSDAGDDKYGAQGACEDWVKDQLKAPSTADFGGEDISGPEEGPWTITGYVDAENGFGANIRADWTCDVRLDTDDYYRGTATLLE